VTHLWKFKQICANQLIALKISPFSHSIGQQPKKEVDMAATKEKEKKESKEGGSSAKGFRPLGDRVFVTYTEELERTAGGIYVPDSAREKPQRGTIEAAGPDAENVKVGDQVLFDKYSGTKIKIENTDCLILKEEDILGVFEN
jgi:chaperonin GroES